MVLFFMGLTLFVSLNGQTVGAEDKHIVQLYYDNQQRTVPTRAKTVGDLLERLKIPLDAKDIVEPARDAPIVEDNFKVNIYRARQVEVVDGTKRIVVKSANQSPNALAREAGFDLKREDAARFEQPNESLKGPIVADKLVVERSIPIRASLYGAVALYRTRAKTVGDFLKTKNIQLKQGETTQPTSLEAPLTSDMLLSVNLPGKQVVATEEAIPFDMQSKSNNELKAGQSKVVQEGISGKRAVLYELEVKDGKEVSRKPLQSVTITEPTPKIIEKGTQAVALFSVSGDRATLMAQAGIDPSQYAAVDYVVSHESGWIPARVSANGCLGLGQRCGSRTGANALVSACPSWQTDPVCQLKHFTAYANSRYGSWQGAYSAWLAQRWW